MKLLLSDLDNYAEFWGEHSSQALQRYREFVGEAPDCCLRTHLAGHCTGSALIYDPEAVAVLLLFHPKLQRWLQPGGHADGDSDLLRVAHREAHEETGLALELLRPLSPRCPLDLDIHEIPARGSEPTHFHYDLRWLLLTDQNHPLRPETPNLELAWIPVSEVSQKTQEASVLRMLDKLERLSF